MALYLQREFKLAGRDAFGVEQDLAEPAPDRTGRHQQADEVTAFGLDALQLRWFGLSDQADAHQRFAERAVVALFGLDGLSEVHFHQTRLTPLEDFFVRRGAGCVCRGPHPCVDSPLLLATQRLVPLVLCIVHFHGLVPARFRSRRSPA